MITQMIRAFLAGAGIEMLTDLGICLTPSITLLTGRVD